MDRSTICTCSLRGLSMVKLDRKKIMTNIQSDIDVLQQSLLLDFKMIALTQHQIRHARKAFDTHEREAKLDSLINFCINGKHDD